MAKESPLREKSYQFALRIVKLCRYLKDECKEFVLSTQILQSGTAICSKIEHSSQAESSADFIHFRSAALQKAVDTHFWLRLLRDSEYITDKQAESMLNDCEELQKMLTSSVKTAKNKISDRG